jgi:hypothetical protein
MAEFRRATDELKDEFRQMEREVEDSTSEASTKEDPTPGENPADPAAPADTVSAAEKK